MAESSVRRPGGKGSHAEHELSADDAHGEPYASLLVAGQEHTGGDEANHTGNGRKTVHCLCSGGVIEDFTRQRVHRFDEQVQQTQTLKHTPNHEQDTHHLGST